MPVSSATPLFCLTKYDAMSKTRGDEDQDHSAALTLTKDAAIAAHRERRDLRIGERARTTMKKGRKGRCTECAEVAVSHDCKSGFLQRQCRR